MLFVSKMDGHSCLYWIVYINYDFLCKCVCVQKQNERYSRHMFNVYFYNTCAIHKLCHNDGYYYYYHCVSCIEHQ